jgi:hypothetical protein
MEQIKLLGMTAILTALIWAAADSLVNETITVGMSFSLAPEAGHAGLLVELDGDPPSFQIELSGPHEVIAQIEAAAPLSVRLTIPEGPMGATAIPLLKMLEEQWRAYPKVSVLSVKPAKLDVVRDHMIEREFRLARKPLTLAYEFEPQLERNAVSLRLRESRFEKLVASGRSQRIEVDPEPLLRDKTPGESVTVPVTLTLDPTVFGDDARIIPNVVQVTATLKARRRTAEIGTVPVLLAVSFANFGKPVRAVAPDGSTPLVTRKITVAGPTEAVDRLLSGERPVGIIRLKAEDLEDFGVQRSFRPEFHLPVGIELAEEPEPVAFMLVAQD